MLLSRFASPEGDLWVYAKDKLPRKSIAKNECVERDFFEFELNGKKTENRYENWLAKIESDAAGVIESVIQQRQMSDSDAEIWATFVGALFGRTRKVRAQISDSMTRKFRELTEDPEYIRNLQYSLLQKGELHFSEDLIREVSSLRSAMETSPSYYHVSALPNRVRILMQPLLSRKWHTVEAPEGHNFLTSDCPVLTLGVREGQPALGAGFGLESTAILLPVTSKHIFVASPHNVDWKTIVGPAEIESINRLIVQFAHQNVYSDANTKAVQDLVNSDINKIIFGETAFVPTVR
jgi:hypothetical protein